MTVSNNIREIFESEYSIPIYQRAFAWTEKEINTLIDDVYDYYCRSEKQNYYIGTLVVHDDSKGVISVIDGQQRLTTLSLVIYYLRNESLYSKLADNVDVTLNFESRVRSTEILGLLKRNDSFDRVLDLDNELTNGYRIIKKKFQETKEPNSSVKFDEGYFRYFLENVILVKNVLPKDTDLNHYFEIMNNRGEQLEKHEIIKAYLLGLLPETDSKGRSVISQVWDACQRMDKYVQLGFKTNSNDENSDIRSKLFGENWDEFKTTDFYEVIEAFSDDNNSSLVKTSTISQILTMTLRVEEVDESDDTGRYHSIINFPNFILIVLKLYKDKEKFDWNYESRGISLDDKRLVDQFKQEITSANQVYEYMYLLLKTRFVFDNYVIKTDSINDNSYDDSNWSLHKPHMLSTRSKKLSPRNTFDEDTQNIVIKIESMFQVTDPRQIYKSFLFGLLQILSDKNVLDDPKCLVKKLIAFATQRFVALTTDDSLFSKGVDTHNYIFNFLDFVLWYQQEIHKEEYGIKSYSFEFKYRNSVEHFYPQNPNEEEGHKKLPKDELDNFGNLCIMARRHNTQRSNLIPNAKIKEFKNKDQSLKFELMEKITEKDGVWYTSQILKHGEDMKEILLKFVQKHQF